MYLVGRTHSFQPGFKPDAELGKMGTGTSGYGRQRRSSSSIPIIISRVHTPRTLNLQITPRWKVRYLGWKISLNAPA